MLTKIKNKIIKMIFTVMFISNCLFLLKNRINLAKGVRKIFFFFIFVLVIFFDLEKEMLQN